MTSGSSSPDTRQSDAVAVRALAVRRMWVGLLLTILMFALYTFYLLLNSYAKGFLAQQVVPGITAAMIVGILSLIIPCFLAGIYMRWANRNLDTACDRLGQGGAR